MNSVSDLRVLIDELDWELIGLLQRRRVLSDAAQSSRLVAGGTRFDYAREAEITERYRQVLGVQGVEFARVLLPGVRLGV